VPRAATGQSSGKPKPPTPTTAEILDSLLTLAGPSDLPDPAFNAYRKDLADIALAGRVIASHYAEPLRRQIAQSTRLLAGPSDEAEIVGELAAGDDFEMLDNSVGWAWGYAGPQRRVGYVKSEAIAP
jgi:hypothetical protein